MCSQVFDSRMAALRQWLDLELGLQLISIAPASSDASFRRYFRVKHAGGCDIVMDAPPDKENVLPFIRNAALFKTAIHVPSVFQQNIEQGFLLLEDLGCQCYLDVLQEHNADALYRQALGSLFDLQCGVDIVSCGLPSYDRVLLARELGIFYEWFLDKRLQITVPESVRVQFDDCLIESALQQPQVCVHRDYHSRNLMFLPEHSPGVIDFQDAVIGPLTYDLVSLLRDCYIRWPNECVQQWLQSYYRRLTDAGLLLADFAEFKRWFDLMGLQRHLKAVGIFSRLDLRDGKPGYLADIPRTMGYIDDVCRNYPELSGFNDFLQQQILPIYQSKL